MTNTGAVPRLPATNAQVLETAMILRVKLRRTYTPHIIEQIIDMAEYWPSITVTPEEIEEHARQNDRDDVLVGTIPDRPGSRLLKLHLRFCNSCTRATHTPESHTTASPSMWRLVTCVPPIRTSPGIAVYKNREGLAEIYLAAGLNADPPAPQTQELNLSCTGLYSSCACHPKIKARREIPEQGELPDRDAGNWFDEVFYVDGRNAHSGDGLQLARGFLRDREPGSKLWLRRFRALKGLKVHVEAVLYLAPRVGFDRMIVL